jgi:hypothetical protein
MYQVRQFTALRRQLLSEFGMLGLSARKKDFTPSR